MRAHTQRVEGWPHGECVRASLASVLGVPLEAVPPLDPASCEAAGETQARREERWLRTRGVGVVRVSVPRDPAAARAVLDRVPAVKHLMTGVSPRGLGHRVVGWGGHVLHDPHPSRAGLVRVLSVEFLVPLGDVSEERREDLGTIEGVRGTRRGDRSPEWDVGRETARKASSAAVTRPPGWEVDVVDGARGGRPGTWVLENKAGHALRSRYL